MHEALGHGLQQFVLGPQRFAPRRTAHDKLASFSPILSEYLRDADPGEAGVGGWLREISYFGYVPFGVWLKSVAAEGAADFANLQRWVGLDLNTGVFHDLGTLPA